MISTFCILLGDKTAAAIIVLGFTLMAFTYGPETPRAEVKRPTIRCKPAEPVFALYLGVTSCSENKCNFKPATEATFLMTTSKSVHHNAQLPKTLYLY